MFFFCVFIYFYMFLYKNLDLKIIIQKVQFKVLFRRFYSEDLSKSLIKKRAFSKYSFLLEEGKIDESADDGAEDNHERDGDSERDTNSLRTIFNDHGCGLFC